MTEAMQEQRINWLYADNPIGAIPQDLDVYFTIEDPDPAIPAATLGPRFIQPGPGDDFYLIDMDGSQSGVRVDLVSGTWGQQGAVYRKRLRSGITNSSNWRTRMRLDALAETPPVNEGGFEYVQINIVDLQPVGTPQYGYAVSSFNSEFRWVIVDRP
jgi:hypothetical protein